LERRFLAITTVRSQFTYLPKLSRLDIDPLEQDAAACPHGIAVAPDRVAAVLIEHRSVR